MYNQSRASNVPLNVDPELKAHHVLVYRSANQSRTFKNSVNPLSSLLWNSRFFGHDWQVNIFLGRYQLQNNVLEGAPKNDYSRTFKVPMQPEQKSSVFGSELATGKMQKRIALWIQFNSQLTWFIKVWTKKPFSSLSALT